jgi:ubiquinol-cytochrome c reductase cytochrome c1 subunit
MSIRSLIALVPVCALAVACGGSATPEPATPDAAAAGEAKPADAAAPAGDAAKPADAAAPAGDAAAAPAEEKK